MFAERVVERVPSNLGGHMTGMQGFALVIGLSLAGLIVSLLTSIYSPTIVSILVASALTLD